MLPAKNNRILVSIWHTLRGSFLAQWGGFAASLVWAADLYAQAPGKETRAAANIIARIDGRETPLVGRSILSVPATAHALTLGFTPDAGHRKRFRLEGVDTAWREGPGEMRLCIRFADSSGEQIHHIDFPIIGESPGWNGDLQQPAFVPRRETIVVPPDANLFWLELSSAGPPETLGAALVTDLSVSRVGSSGSVETLLRGPSGRKVDSRFPKALTPDGFIRDGPRPSMARLITLNTSASAVPFDCLAIIDEDPNTHAEWHTIKQEGPQVAPGERLSIAWNEAYSVGYGFRVEEGYPLPPAGEYRFRLQSLDFLGRPVGAESSLQIRVLAPWWKSPWVWLAALGLIAGGVVTLARNLAHRRVREQLAHVKEERLIEQERLRIARDIHDTLAQGFTGVVVLMEAAEEALSQNMSGKVGEYIIRAGDLARESLREARRSVQALRPQATGGDQSL